MVTGLGAVSPVAIGAHKMFDALCEGKSGISRLPSWADEFPAQLGATVKNFDPKEHGLKGKTISRNARYTHFAMIAAQQALLDGAIDLSSIDKERFGVIVGSGIGGIEWYEDSVKTFAKTEETESSYRALRSVNPFLIPALISNTASGMIAIEHGAKGPNYAVATACATGSHAIGAALKHLRDGEADVMLAVRPCLSRCWLCLCNARCLYVRAEAKRPSPPWRSPDFVLSRRWRRSTTTPRRRRRGPSTRTAPASSCTSGRFDVLNAVLNGRLFAGERAPAL